MPRAPSWLPRTAVRGNQLGALGMVLAIVATLVSGQWDWTYIILGIGIGSFIGAVAALRVKMTSMPELVGLFNGFGGAASWALSSLSFKSSAVSYARSVSSLISPSFLFPYFTFFSPLKKFLNYTHG